MATTFDAHKIGDSASFSKTVSETDIYLFAGITGDMNPAHVNAVAAAEGMFKQRIAHGMLSGSFISTVLAMQLPGEDQFSDKFQLRLGSM